MLFDASRFRLDLFVGREELLIHQLEHEKYLAPSTVGRSYLHNVRVNLAQRGYDIAIGSGNLAETGQFLAQRLAPAHAVVITDQNVEDPYALYEWLREESPVHWDAKLEAFVVSRHADVLAVLRDAETFSSSVGAVTQPPPAEAIAIIDAYEPPSEPFVPWEPAPGRAAWSTEAPRGVLFHRYQVGEDGRVVSAQIVPPTSQNQAFMEDDMRDYVASVLDLPETEAAARLEALIRCYDPCISCATHFLSLEIERT